MAEGRAGLSALPVVMAIMTVALLSLFAAAAIMRVQLDYAVRAQEQAHQVAERQTWLKAYVYDVSLCQLLKLQNLILLNRTLGNITVIYDRPDLENASAGIYSVSLKAPAKLLIINEGPPAVLEALAVEAYGELRRELRPGLSLGPGGCAAFSPADLGLPPTVELIYFSRPRIVAYTSLQESFEVPIVYSPPDPASVVEVDEGGKCQEP